MSGSQLGVMLLPRACFSVSGGFLIFMIVGEECPAGISWEEVRNAAKHPTVYKAAPCPPTPPPCPQQSYLAHNVRLVLRNFSLNDINI